MRDSTKPRMNAALFIRILLAATFTFGFTLFSFAHYFIFAYYSAGLLFIEWDTATEDQINQEARQMYYGQYDFIDTIWGSAFEPLNNHQE